jgi:hypothetical protein
MCIRPIALLLVLSLLHFGSAPGFARNEIEKQVKYAAKVKQSVLKLGVGREARIAVRLRDRSQLVGFVSETGESSFVVTNAKTGTSTVVAYPEVTQVKGHNLSTGAKIAIGAAIVAAIILLLFLRTYCNNEGGC